MEKKLINILYIFRLKRFIKIINMKILIIEKEILKIILKIYFKKIFFEKYILIYINRNISILKLESNLLIIYRYLRIFIIIHNIIFDIIYKLF